MGDFFIILYYKKISIDVGRWCAITSRSFKYQYTISNL